MKFSNTIEAARHLDEQDDLKQFRAEFLLPGVENGPAIYFLGNSLGLQPKRTASYLQDVLTQWHHHGVEGFFKGAKPWLSYHETLTPLLAPIVGALPHEIVVMNQLTVNLHLMLISFYELRGRRTKILCEAKAFPSDQYMLETHLRSRGLNPEEHIIEVAPEKGTALVSNKSILEAISQHKEELALVFLGGVNYYSGQVFDMAGIAAAARTAGISIGYDLAHAAGNVPLHLHDWDVDFACWCNYKYLNSGPGAIGGVFIHERHHKNNHLNRFAGWWGYKNETRFLMQKGFQPVESAEGWALSTPAPVLFAAHKAALELFAEAGMNRLLHKSRRLGDYLFFVLYEVLKKFDKPPFQILTTPEPNDKGSQVSLLIADNGKVIFDYLSANGIYADWREPGVIRIAPVPLYNTFEEVWRFGAVLERAFRTMQTPELFKTPI